MTIPLAIFLICLVVFTICAVVITISSVRSNNALVKSIKSLDKPEQEEHNVSIRYTNDETMPTETKEFTQ